jgi:hypothetical protein
MLSRVSSSHNLACYSPSFEQSEHITVYFLAHQTSTLRSLSVAPYTSDREALEQMLCVFLFLLIDPQQCLFVCFIQALW